MVFIHCGIAVSKQSFHRDLVINQALGCRYFPLGPRLPSHPQHYRCLICSLQRFPWRPLEANSWYRLTCKILWLVCKMTLSDFVYVCLCDYDAVFTVDSQACGKKLWSLCLMTLCHSYPFNRVCHFLPWHLSSVGYADSECVCPCIFTVLCYAECSTAERILSVCPSVTLRYCSHIGWVT